MTEDHDALSGASCGCVPCRAFDATKAAILAKNVAVCQTRKAGVASRETIVRETLPRARGDSIQRAPYQPCMRRAKANGSSRSVASPSSASRSTSTHRT